ncbi:MAG: Lrp/AsnC ligand binding domain-containing protein [Planctomycetota bacterium]|jgi:DNA-binding Lrp family transcriptional regulator
MARAFVRICITPGFEVKIRDALRTLPEVVSADVTAGEQDLIALIKGNSFEDILNTVVTKVRSREGIKITWTNFILES